jgi:hypothetical protein
MWLAEKKTRCKVMSTRAMPHKVRLRSSTPEAVTTQLAEPFPPIRKSVREYDTDEPGGHTGSLSTLTESDRDILYRYYVNGHSGERIAADLNTSVLAVDFAKARAKALIAQRFNTKHPAPQWRAA